MILNPLMFLFFLLLNSFLISDLRSENSLLYETLVEVFFGFNRQLASKATIMASLLNYAATSKLSNV